MILASNTPCQYFPIWSPKWSSRHDPAIGEITVLLDSHRLGLHNEVEFTRVKSPRFSGKWYVSGDEARRWPLVTNGSIPCYQIPLSRFEVLERRSQPQSIIETNYDELKITPSQTALAF